MSATSTNLRPNVDHSGTSSTTTEIYQFKILLQRTMPAIWRRIQIPGNCSFFDLHVAIQDLFRWSGLHFHKFEMVTSKLYFFSDPNLHIVEYICIPNETLADNFSILPEKETRLDDQFSIIRSKCVYIYDSGNITRKIDITLEETSVALPNINYPICIKGVRQPPSEDCWENENEKGAEPPFSKDSIVFRNPDEVWRTTAIQKI